MSLYTLSLHSSGYRPTFLYKSFMAFVSCLSVLMRKLQKAFNLSLVKLQESFARTWNRLHSAIQLQLRWHFVRQWNFIIYNSNYDDMSECRSNHLACIFISIPGSESQFQSESDTWKTWKYLIKLFKSCPSGLNGGISIMSIHHNHISATKW